MNSLHIKDGLIKLPFQGARGSGRYYPRRCRRVEITTGFQPVLKRIFVACVSYKNEYRYIYG